MPPRLWFELAAQDLAIERKGLVFGRSVQIRRRSVHAVPAEIHFPVVERTFLGQLIQRLHELRLADDDVRHRVQTHGGQVTRKRQIRIIPDDIRHRELVVIGDRIAQIHARLRSLGERGFNLHHGCGMRFGQCGLLAQQDEHFGNVSRVSLALLGEGLREVVIAVGHSQPALAQLECIDGTVFRIRRNPLREASADAVLVKIGQQ